MKHVKTCRYCATNYNLLPGILLTPLYGPGHVVKETADKQLRHIIGYGGGAKAQQAVTWLSGFRLALKLWNWHLGWEWHLDPGVVYERPDSL